MPVPWRIFGVIAKNWKISGQNGCAVGKIQRTEDNVSSIAKPRAYVKIRLEIEYTMGDLSDISDTF